MAVSSRSELHWSDDHQLYLSHLYSLYHRKVALRNQICDFNYRGYPDPLLEGDGPSLKPDFLSINESDGDVQHISICNKGSLINGSGEIAEAELRTKFEEARSYKDIPDRSVEDYVEIYDIEFDPKIHESVLLVSKQTYNRNTDLLMDLAQDYDSIVWTIRPNGSAIVQKEIGEHANPDIDELLEDGLKTYRNGSELLPYTRNTDDSLLLFAFTQRLVKRSRNTGERHFTFSEIDNIMMDMHPPMLAHLVVEEREDYWKGFLHSLLTRFELLEQTASNEYKWKKQRFVKEPRYSNSILDNIADDLGLKQ